MSEFTLFFKILTGNVSGLWATYIDGTLQVRDLNYSYLTKFINAEFKYKAKEGSNVRFAKVENKKIISESGFTKLATLQKLKKSQKKEATPAGDLCRQNLLGTLIPDRISLTILPKALKLQKNYLKKIDCHLYKYQLDWNTS